MNYRVITVTAWETGWNPRILAGVQVTARSFPEEPSRELRYNVSLSEAPLPTVGDIVSFETPSIERAESLNP